MRCPYCRQDQDRVIDSRASEGGGSIRRRRECLACGRRYTTYERAEEIPLRVIKKDGRREPFDPKKILGGVLKACEKRPIAMETLEGIPVRIEGRIHEMFDQEVSSRMIGRLVMQELKELDQVAYVRFASVYREFQDVTDFLEEVRPMLERKAGVEERKEV